MRSNAFHKNAARLALAGGALAAAVAPLLATTALAQSAPPSGYDSRYDDPPQNFDPRYDTRDPRRDQGGQYDDNAPLPEPEPPQGYDGRTLPPPPANYRAIGDVNALRAADDRYAYNAERWARENCTKSQGNVGGGALLGGVLGAIIGSSVAGRHDRGAGAFAGAAIGAVGGAAVASASGSNATSPGCPPGYSLRREAGAYSYDSPDYYYAAPSWYRPWVFIDNGWVYRPYPYHDWYYRTYRHGGRDGYRGGYRGGGYGGGRDWHDRDWHHGH
jgi:hypothetical protein